ncbi:MAG: MarR family transcriptional regulator [Melioribacteraceae bacterium]|nr:MarR family transcriptional regulator [Melioribacteraceae bacterium]
MLDTTNKNLSWELWQELTSTTENLEKSHIKRVSYLNLTNPQFNVLEVLNSEGPISLKDISKKLNVTGANITCVMDNLEKHNFAERIPSRNDRRIIKAEMTEEGKKIFNEITPVYLESITEETNNLNDEEKVQLLELLTKLKT